MWDRAGRLHFVQNLVHSVLAKLRRQIGVKTVVICARNEFPRVFHLVKNMEAFVVFEIGCTELTATAGAPFVMIFTNYCEWGGRNSNLALSYFAGRRFRAVAAIRLFYPQR